MRKHANMTFLYLTSTLAVIGIGDDYKGITNMGAIYIMVY